MRFIKCNSNNKKTFSCSELIRQLALNSKDTLAALSIQHHKLPPRTVSGRHVAATTVKLMCKFFVLRVPISWCHEVISSRPFFFCSFSFTPQHHEKYVNQIIVNRAEKWSIRTVSTFIIYIKRPYNIYLSTRRGMSNWTTASWSAPWCRPTFIGIHNFWMDGQYRITIWWYGTPCRTIIHCGKSILYIRVVKSIITAISNGSLSLSFSYWKREGHPKLFSLRDCKAILTITCTHSTLPNTFPTPTKSRFITGVFDKFEFDCMNNGNRIGVVSDLYASLAFRRNRGKLVKGRLTLLVISHTTLPPFPLLSTVHSASLPIDRFSRHQ